MKPWSALRVRTRPISKKGKEPLRLNSVKIVPGRHQERFVCSGPPPVRIPLVSKHPRGFDRMISREQPGLMEHDYVPFEDNLSPLEALLKMYQEDEVMSDPGTLPTFPYSPVWKDEDLVKKDWEDSPWADLSVFSVLVALSPCFCTKVMHVY